MVKRQLTGHNIKSINSITTKLISLHWTVPTGHRPPQSLRKSAESVSMGQMNIEDIRQSGDILKKLQSEGSSCIAGTKGGELSYVKQH